MPETADSGLPRFPIRRTCPFLPPAEYARLRAESPVTKVLLPNGSTAWVISSYELTREFIAHPDTTIDRSHPSYPAVLPVQPVPKEQAKGWLNWMDPPEHTIHRRMVLSEFTVKRVAGMAPHIQQITDECVEAMLAGPRPVDLVEALALAVPTRATCELLGVPYADRTLFAKRTTVILNHHTPPAQRLSAWQELRSYLAELVTAKDISPGEDLLSRVVRKYRNAGSYDHDLLTGLAMILLIAGHETTANVIALGAVFLMDNPGHLADFRAHPDRASRTVDEMLRYFSIADFSVSRVTTADIEIGGVVIPAGEGVITLQSAANHDDTVFEHPEEFNPLRESLRHVAFGYGPHQCPGASMARLELEIVFTTLFSRIPDIRLAAPLDELPFKNDSTFYGFYEVPVTW